MDIEKLISDAITKVTNDAATGEFDYFKNYPSLSEKSKEYSMLMYYSEFLLSAYHEELKQELAKHGIQI